MKRTLITIALLTLLVVLVPAILLAQTATLDTPVVTARADGGEIELPWEAVADASGYEVWAWTEGDGSQTRRLFEA